MACDLVVVCVSLDREHDVLMRAAALRSAPRILAEIGSLKTGLLPALRMLARQGHTVLALHPLFGPGAGSWKGQQMPLVPVAARADELAVARRIFPGASIEPIAADAHDRAMARVLALAHAVNVVFAAGLGGKEAAALDRLGGPVFRLQRMLSAAVLSEDPNFYAQLQARNPHAAAVLLRARDALTDWTLAVRRGDERSLVSIFRRAARVHRGRSSDYRRMYEVMKTL